MALSTTLPIKRAIVRRLRNNGPVRTALVGGIHQRLTPRRERYPFLVYSEVGAPFVEDWGSGGDQGRREIHALYDLDIYGTDEVGVENLLQQVDWLFSDPGAKEALDVDGQTVMVVRTSGKTPMGPERDAVGNRISRAGISVYIETDQPIPAS